MPPHTRPEPPKSNVIPFPNPRHDPVPSVKWDDTAVQVTEYQKPLDLYDHTPQFEAAVASYHSKFPNRRPTRVEIMREVNRERDRIRESRQLAESSLSYRVLHPHRPVHGGFPEIHTLSEHRPKRWAFEPTDKIIARALVLSAATLVGLVVCASLAGSIDATTWPADIRALGFGIGLAAVFLIMGVKEL